jgi:hypothetical protein
VITLEQALTGYVEEITETEPCDAPNSWCGGLAVLRRLYFRICVFVFHYRARR